MKKKEKRVKERTRKPEQTKSHLSTFQLSSIQQEHSVEKYNTQLLAQIRLLMCVWLCLCVCVYVCVCVCVCVWLGVSRLCTRVGPLRRIFFFKMRTHKQLQLM